MMLCITLSPKPAPSEEEGVQSPTNQKVGQRKSFDVLLGQAISLASVGSSSCSASEYYITLLSLRLPVAWTHIRSFTPCAWRVFARAIVVQRGSLYFFEE